MGVGGKFPDEKLKGVGGVSGMSEPFAQNKYTIQSEFFPRNFRNVTYIHISEF